MSLAVEEKVGPKGERVESDARLRRGASKGRGAGQKRIRMEKQVIMGAIFLGLLGGGWFYPLIGYFIPLCMVAGVGLAFFRGRKWCNWYCPRGAFADAYMKFVSPGRPIPQVFRRLPLRVGVLAFLMGMLAFRIGRLWPDITGIGGFFMILLTVTTAIGVVLSMALHQRTWCYICPIGTLSRWAGRNRRPVVLNREKCVACKVCGKACPMELAPYEENGGSMAGRGDCLKCGLCVAVCPKEALKLS